MCFVEILELYEDGKLEILLPKLLAKKINSGYLFYGYSPLKNYWVIGISIDYTHAFKKSDVKNMIKSGPAQVKVDGVEFAFHYWGKSRFFSFGFESQSTCRIANTSIELPRWSNLFLHDGKCVSIDIGVLKKGMQWDVFSKTAEQIIKSFRINGD